MIEVNSVLFMGLWELVLLLLAVDVVVIVRFIIRRRREKASIERLVALVKQDAERRQQETHNLLEKKYNYSDEKLEKTTKKIMREEKRIYQILANLFTTRDNVAIENLSIAFEEAVEPYRTLEVPKIVEADDAEGEGEDNSTELKRLKEQNQELSDELKVTMNTISRMLHEYSNIFSEAGADKKDQAAVAELIANNQMPEDSPQELAEDDIKAISEEMSETTTDMPDEEAVSADENLDSAALVGMFQEEDDALAGEEAVDNEIATSAIDSDTANAVSVEEGKPNDEPGPESSVEKTDPVEDVLDQEIDEVLGGFDTDLSDLEGGETTDDAAEVATDPLDELLAQAVDESHEAPLPDVVEESIPDEPDAEKQLTDEIAKTLNGHSENLSDEDIDSLLQGAIEDIAEK